MWRFRNIVATLILLLLTITLLWQQTGNILEQWQKFRIRNETIIIAFTTTPHRIHALKKSIDNLALQSVTPSKIYVNIPYVYKRGNLVYEIPAEIQNDPRITILRTKDYGPATKILGVLEQVDLPDDAIIITIDDDIHYPTNLIAHLAYAAQNNPDAAVSITGANLIYDQDGKLDLATGSGLSIVNYEQKDVSIVCGYTGVAYRKKFFEKDVFAIENAIFPCIASDDLYLSFYLAKKHIARRVVADRFLNRKKIIIDPIGWQSDALHKMDRPVKKHRACVEYMQELDPDVIF